MTTALSYCSGIEEPLRAFLHGTTQATEDWGADISRQIHLAPKYMQRTTEGAFGIAMISGFAIDFDIPTNPPVANVIARTQEKLAVAVYQFDLISSDRAVFSFLKSNNGASELLTILPTILDSIFSEEAEKKLEIILDREANQKIMTVEVQTGIEDEEVFFEAEEKLFNLIERCGLENGLKKVVLSLY